MAYPLTAAYTESGQYFSTFSALIIYHIPVIVRLLGLWRF